MQKYERSKKVKKVIFCHRFKNPYTLFTFYIGFLFRGQFLTFLTFFDFFNYLSSFLILAYFSACVGL